MLLAEALNARKRYQKVVGEAVDRMIELATRDEDEEDTTGELNVARSALESALTEWHDITSAIHRANTEATLADGTTLVEAILLRDRLAMKHLSLRKVLEATGSNKRQTWYERQRRSKDDVKEIAQLDRKALAKDVDAVAEQIRLLDIEIQKVNWTTEL